MLSSASVGFLNFTLKRLPAFLSPALRWLLCSFIWAFLSSALAARQAAAAPPGLQLLADVYIFTDHMTGPAAGSSPGYGITLVAETTSGRLLASEAAAALDGGGAAAAGVPAT